MNGSAARPVPKGFEANGSFSASPPTHGVRFDPNKNQLRDDRLPGTYTLTSYTMDERESFTLHTGDRELVSILNVQYRRTSPEHYSARIYFIHDNENLSTAGKAVRDRLDLASFASALAATPRFQRANSSYKIYYKPLAPGEVL
jgi:hypothetical protein